MTLKEAKEAFLNESRVVYGGSFYNRIIRLSFEKDRYKQIIETATLEDKCKNSEIKVRISDIHSAD